MKLHIFPNLTLFLNSFVKNNLTIETQINLLLSNSFPDEFDLSDGKTYIDQLRSLLESEHLKHESIITFVAIVSNKIWGFAQVIYETAFDRIQMRVIDKARLINFCRDKSNYKGLGAGILNEIYKFQGNERMKNERMKNETKLYLTVDNDNEKLQNYYKSIGWKTDNIADMRGKKAGLEFFILV
jgi:hypothetical protein